MAHTALAFLNARVLLIVKGPAAATKVELGEETAGASAAHEEQAAATTEVDRNMEEEATAAGHQEPAEAAQD